MHSSQCEKLSLIRESSAQFAALILRVSLLQTLMIACDVWAQAHNLDCWSINWVRTSHKTKQRLCSCDFTPHLIFLPVYSTSWCHSSFRIQHGLTFDLMLQITKRHSNTTATKLTPSPSTQGTGMWWSAVCLVPAQSQHTVLSQLWLQVPGGNCIEI